MTVDPEVLVELKRISLELRILSVLFLLLALTLLLVVDQDTRRGG